MIVFYSWQSDLPNATNRGFIQDALDKACKALANHSEIEEAPRVDKDTQGLAGSPLIPTAIMDKIDACQAFVADVTLCFTGPNGKLAPNPNVVYELGYAVARLGWERIVLVVNEEYGAVELLPFDLEKRRAIPYRASEGEANRSEAKKSLVGRLTAGVEAIVRQQPIVPQSRPASVAIEAIESLSPARRARIREFWGWMMSELRRVEPDLRSTPPEGESLNRQIEDLKASVTNTAPIMSAWSRICEAVAYSNDAEAAEAIGRGFGPMLEKYDHEPGFSGGSYDTWFDFWRFIGHEALTIWIGCLLKEERWELIDSALGRTYFWEQHRAKTNNGTVYFDEFSVYVHLFGVEGERTQRLSFHADLLAQRYSPDGIGSVLTFQEFIDADLLLFLAGEFRLESGWSGWLHWRPWSVLYLKHQPRFLTEASSKKSAAGVKLALGEQDSEKIRSLIKERVPKLRELWRQGFWRSPITNEVIDAFDSKG